LTAILLWPVCQFTGCSVFDGTFGERVITGTVFDGVQLATFNAFFQIGSGAL
jgi:hypothetical protein